ncbi:NAD(P)/FAD-dependent oxidoreductase [Paenibacillus contaminans]|jgi:thioredoxin reductase|uniref:Pyridine nucleotide-disulfide oxidoreductase n=1 Tax=Paenibacillus contaminans TaxID=450362 RepID=A0A329M8T3_9BACL|nr:NAD(P)/FAD-dependent oxidoreductase [Paenibacillus contaminans]RAV16385.1 pyridine nucleotide-disulfide oxidoreductase [Paenibacillus contaminans]
MYDIVIIGGGPAGSSAAIFAAKSGKKTLVIDNDKSVTKRAWVENHYGVKEITGPDLVAIGKEQAAKFGAEYVEDKATGIAKSGEGLTVSTENGSYEAKHVIVATGMMVDVAEASGIEVIPGTEPRIAKILKVDAAGRTNVDGVWSAGTCAGVSMHTIVTAGDGAKVAINVISELNGARYVDHDVLKA